MKNILRKDEIMVKIRIEIDYGEKEKEIKIGKKKLIGGMEIDEVYIKKIEMEKEGMMRKEKD